MVDRYCCFKFSFLFVQFSELCSDEDSESIMSSQLSETGSPMCQSNSTSSPRNVFRPSLEIPNLSAKHTNLVSKITSYAFLPFNTFRMDSLYRYCSSCADNSNVRVDIVTELLFSVL